MGRTSAPTYAGALRSDRQKPDAYPSLRMLVPTHGWEQSRRDILGAQLVFSAPPPAP